MVRRARFAKLASVLLAAAVFAVFAGGCSWIKPGSLSGSQPSGIGTVRVHFDICTLESEEPRCGPPMDEPAESFQYLVGIAVPPGSAPPATLTATPVGGGSPVLFTRNDEVTAELAATAPVSQQTLDEVEGELDPELMTLVSTFFGGPWPPAGREVFGYLSTPVAQKGGDYAELSVDADFGLPPVAGDGPYPGPFPVAIAFAIREIDDDAPANRPVRCMRVFELTDPYPAVCSGSLQEAQIDTSDLRIGAPARPAQAFVGGRSTISFPLHFASTNPAGPSFGLSATTNAPGARVVASPSIFKPGAPAPATHLSPAATGDVEVRLPRKIKPGTYEVNLDATTLGGASVTGATTLAVTRPTLKVGKAKLNRARGFATLTVRVPAAGRVIVTGKGVKRVKKFTRKAKRLKLRIAPKGRIAARLARTGRATVKAKLTYKPRSGIAVAKRKKIGLRRR